MTRTRRLVRFLRVLTFRIVAAPAIHDDRDPRIWRLASVLPTAFVGGSSSSKERAAVAPPDKCGGCGRAGTGAPVPPGSSADPASTGWTRWVHASAIGRPMWIQWSSTRDSRSPQRRQMNRPIHPQRVYGCSKHFQINGVLACVSARLRKIDRTCIEWCFGSDLTAYGLDFGGLWWTNWPGLGLVRTRKRLWWTPADGLPWEWHSEGQGFESPRSTKSCIRKSCLPARDRCARNRLTPYLTPNLTPDNRVVSRRAVVLDPRESPAWRQLAVFRRHDADRQLIGAEETIQPWLRCPPTGLPQPLSARMSSKWTSAPHRPAVRRRVPKGYSVANCGR